MKRRMISNMVKTAHTRKMVSNSWEFSNKVESELKTEKNKSNNAKLSIIF